MKDFLSESASDALAELDLELDAASAGDAGRERSAPAAVTVSVVIPTLRRPKPLERAIASIQAQEVGADCGVEIVVVDNSPEAAEREHVAQLAQGARFPIRYVSETQTGVSSARNRGVREARGAFIAFLDDDEQATRRWLVDHLAALQASGADASFGPVMVAADGEQQLGPFERYFRRGIDRDDKADISDLASYLGTNNSVFRADRSLGCGRPFDTTLDAWGGEDSLLLQRLVRSGRKLVWAADAGVVEWVPPRRLTWSYVWRRKFLSGQVRCFVLDMLEPRPRHEIAVWMAVGAVQAVGFGALAMALRPFSREKSAHYSAIAYGGLGKLFWSPRFRPVLYGAGLVS